MKTTQGLLLILITSLYASSLVASPLTDQEEQELQQAILHYQASMNVSDNEYDAEKMTYGSDYKHIEHTPRGQALVDNFSSPTLDTYETDKLLARYDSSDDLNTDYISQYPIPSTTYPDTALDTYKQKTEEINAAIERYKTNLEPQKNVKNNIQKKPQKPIQVRPVTEPAKKSVVSEEDKTIVSFGGYIKPEAYWDTRQIVNERDGEFLFYPMPFFPDAVGSDINANGEFDMLAIQTRVNMKVTGPRLNKTTQISGFIEGDFFGTDDTTINGFHMRHAMSKITHKDSTFLFGYYWHPILVEECNATDVISFNEGAPFDTYTRNPQMRFEQKYENFKFIVAALSEVDFRSTGTLGPSTTYLRNSIVPIIHGQVQMFIGGHVIGGGVDFRRLKPRLASATNFKVDEHVNSVSGIAYATLNFKHDVQIKGKFIYASNDFSYSMIGGYGITSVNPVTEEQTYTPIRNLSTWFEILGGKAVQPGLFVGYIKNIGASTLLAPISSVPGAQTFDDLIFGRGINIDWALRVSPRIIWNIKNLQVCAELETTHAQYGVVQQNARVCPNDPETNVRLLLATFYYF